MKENLKFTGKLTLCLRGADGKIKERQTIDNLVVDTGRYHIADQLSDQGEAAMSHMEIGTGSTGQVAADTALETPLNRQALASKTQGTGSASLEQSPKRAFSMLLQVVKCCAEQPLQ